LLRGIHVIQEHPLHPDDVARLQALANTHGLTYWVNSFYPHVPAGREWIETALRIQHILDGQIPCAMRLTTSRQLLYSTLDLLLQACGLVNGGTVQVHALSSHDDCFVPVQLALPGGHQALLHLQSYQDPSDPDMFSLVMHQASLMWPCGYLTLEASYGPVVWTSAFHDLQHGNQNHTLYRRANTSDCYAQPTSMVLRNAPSNWRDAFEVDGPSGVARVLDTLCQVLDGASVPTGFAAQHQLALARLWLDVLHVAPPVIQRSLVAPKPITHQMMTGASA